MDDAEQARLRPHPLDTLPIGPVDRQSAGEPDAGWRFLFSRAAQQTEAASAGAAARAPADGSRAARLRTANAQLVVANDRLRAAVADLERHQYIQDALTTAAASGGGESGIAAALHAVSGFPVAVEDRFGNALAWAGPGRPQRYPSPSPRRQAELLAEARRTPGPLRSQDRLIALAQPCDEVLGVVALIDPERRADPHHVFALEHAAVVLAIELAHQRDLAEAELRLRGDLVADLLAGTGTESAHSRAAALGHDLRGPHQILVVRWQGAHDADVVPAVERAARLCQIDALVAVRTGLVVLVAARPAAWGRVHRWSELQHALTDLLRGTEGCIGVGGVRETPSELPRSYAEALHALAIVERSQAQGLTTFDELGVLRLLFTTDDTRGVRQFVRDWLGELIDYDTAKRTELVTTLSQYYDSGCNYDATATALHIHRSTLRYRLKRIRELTGHDLGAVDGRLNLQVATRAWHVLQGSS
ncbi:MAG: transcriptional regulator, CdaR [Blastococcus sp.]|jgi:sugar diacid utilization regulator|nr:transcriptional regulator, CdaR [Blastococcus sp.]